MTLYAYSAQRRDEMSFESGQELVGVTMYGCGHSVHTHTHIHTHIRTHACTHARTYTRACAHTHTHTHTYTHTHTHTTPDSVRLQVLAPPNLQPRIQGWALAANNHSQGYVTEPSFPQIMYNIYSRITDDNS